jgi:hypothetical protein
MNLERAAANSVAVHQNQEQHERDFPSIIDRNFLELNIEEQNDRISTCTKLFG